MKQAPQAFANHTATLDEDRPPPYRNFLIIVPEPTGGDADAVRPDERVTALAQQFNHDGYAYVARSNQKEMEDDPSGVRYLPLGETLPSFGVMTAVIVIRDPAWAARAAATYPEAEIFLLRLP
jgi:hypothetical protein|uniref:hypothetical protein n=1 Tax=Prosthecobacter sp. TaxID=1965333 RepID=UPI0037847B7C